MERLTTAAFLIVLSISLLSSVTPKNLLPPSSTRTPFLTEKVPTILNISDESVTSGVEHEGEEDQLKVLSSTQPSSSSSLHQSFETSSSTSTTTKTETATTIVNTKSEPSIAHVVIEQQQQQLQQSEEINSFGIRSFTAEVSPRETSSTSTTEPNIKREPSKDPFLSTTGRLSTFTTIPFESSTRKAEAKEVKKDKNIKAKINTPSVDDGSMKDEIPDGMEKMEHQEAGVKDDEKLDNGLYRIKIGEITTDEFSNLLNFDELEDMRDGDTLKLPSEVSLHHEKPKKVNINDFFPSKNEDFTRSTVKKGKNEDKVVEGTQSNSFTSIEVELIEDTTNVSSKDAEEKPKEKLFMASVNTEFIPRRSKKSDVSLDTKMGKKVEEKVHEFAMTKFTSEGSNGTKQQPEFSTTKFYTNNKQLFENILLKPPSSFSATAVKIAPKATPKPALQASKLAQQILVQSPKIPSLVTETTTKQRSSLSTNYPRILTRLEDKLNALDCDVQNLSADSTTWRGNETHQIFLPVTTPEDCSARADCLPLVISWEASADIQSGDVLLVEIDDKFLVSSQKKNLSDDKTIQHNNAAVYQVTRLGHENCDITEGELLDITPLIVDGKKLVTLYDKDLTEGINLLIVVSEKWDQQCVRLRVNVKSDNCGENAECSGKGICFSNTSMEGYECECCTGFSGQHCEEIDACTPSPCTNNGICVDLSQGHDGNSYQCLCPYGYTGKNCQTEVDPCSASQCLNGGTCVTNSTHFRCECKPGFTGPLCQHNLNECESSPCVHGICVDQEDGFRCFCQPGFSGDLCNFEYNECEPNPCVNGGQCLDRVGGYSCQCTKGYEGQRCHIKIDFCANNPCEDGYRCVDHGDEYSCVCPGSNDHNVPDCKEVPRLLCPTNPCSNGGTCWTSDESFYCACPPGFIGKLCEENFNIETVASSSELLSDISFSNVITFDDQHENMQDVEPFDVHSAFVTAGFLVLALVILATVAGIIHFKGSISYRRFSVIHRQLIPYFSRDNKKGKPGDHSNHWLSGKNSSFFEENHINLKSSQQPRQEKSVSRSILNQPLELNIENDLYFSKDYSESIRSPLIQ